MPLLEISDSDHDLVITEDNFTSIGEHHGTSEQIPTQGDIILPWALLKEQPDIPRNRAGKTGVLFPVTGNTDELRSMLPDLSVIALSFDKFTDGRAYSLARILRTHLGYDKELRAIGEILPDQLAFMLQVGFDRFELKPDQNVLDIWRRAASAMSLTYQQDLTLKQGLSPRDIFQERRKKRTAS